MAETERDDSRPTDEVDAPDDAPDDESETGEADDAATGDQDAGDPEPSHSRGRGRRAGRAVRAGADAVRGSVATVVWLLASLCALDLALGALFVALHANVDNAVVAFVLRSAERLDLGVFGRGNGIFHVTTGTPELTNALVNWGIAAILYLVAGKILDRIIRP